MFLSNLLDRQLPFSFFSTGTNLPMLTRGAVLHVPGAQLQVLTWG